MFKNIIIAVLVVVILNLLVQNKQNVDILVNDLVTAKQKLERGTIYLKETIDENFSEKEFQVDIEKEPMIREETFFNEEEK